MTQKVHAKRKARADVIVECGTSFSCVASEIINKLHALPDTAQCVVYVPDDDAQLFQMESALHAANYHLLIEELARIRKEWFDSYIKRVSKQEKRKWRRDFRYLMDPYNFILERMDKKTHVKLKDVEARISGYWTDEKRRRVSIVVNMYEVPGTYNIILPT